MASSIKLCSQFLLHMLPPTMIKTIMTTMFWQQLMATKLCGDNDGGILQQQKR